MPATGLNASSPIGSRAFLGLLDELARIGHELPRDRIVRIAAVDRVGHQRRDRHRIARGDFLQRREPIAAYQMGIDERGWTPQGLSLGESSHG